jgi:hypothetical protein
MHLFDPALAGELCILATRTGWRTKPFFVMKKNESECLALRIFKDLPTFFIRGSFSLHAIETLKTPIKGSTTPHEAGRLSS